MAMETEQQAIARLRAGGYEHEFEMVEDGIRCPECDQVVAPEEVRIDETVRFEGSSNPSDEAVVFALSPRPSGHKGPLVAALGPGVEGDVADVFRRLGRHGRAEPPGDPITEREAAEQVLIEEGESEAGAELGDPLG